MTVDYRRSVAPEDFVTYAWSAWHPGSVGSPTGIDMVTLAMPYLLLVMQTSRTTSVTGVARRRQIVEAAVTVLARDGLASASLARIAAEAGLSSAGLISYHFADKDELLLQVVEHLVGQCAEALRAAVTRALGPAEALSAYIDAFVRFQDENRDGVRALWRLSAAGWKPPGRDTAVDEEPLLAPLREVLDRGQERGVFRRLDTQIVALSVLSSVEAFHQVVRTGPHADRRAFVHEIQSLYRSGTRAGHV